MDLECQMHWLPILKSFIKSAGRPCEREVFNKFAVYRPGISLKTNFEFVIMHISRKYSEQLMYFFNPFHATDLFWYPLETSDVIFRQLMFSGSIKRDQLHEMG